MNFHGFVQSSPKQVGADQEQNLQFIDLSQNKLFSETATNSLLIYATSFTIRTLFIKKFSPSFGLHVWDLILPLCYLKIKSKEYYKSQQTDGIQSKLQLIFEGQLQESEKQKFLKEYNMKFWTNSQYWH